MTQPHDHATAALAARWYARPNDLIGGWCVMPVDQPPSAGVGEVADFTYREIAEHIAELHNARRGGRRPADNMHAPLTGIEVRP